MNPVRIALLASGSGSNAENIIRFFSTDSRVEIVVIVSNKAEASVHERAVRLGIPSVTLPKELLQDDSAFTDWMNARQIDFIVLAGYLLKVPAGMTQAFSGRILNIHPALLPKYGGKGMYGDRVHEAVLRNGEVETGITIHWVNECYDEGAVVFQATCAVLPEDRPEDVAARIHELEYRYYPVVIRDTLQKVFSW